MADTAKLAAMTEILILLFATLLNAFFAASEIAIVSSRRARLKQLADDGSTGAATALTLAEDSGKFLSSVQIGITLIGVFSGAYGGATLSKPLGEYLARFPSLADHADSIAFGIVIAIITYTSLVLGELVPKRLAVMRAEAIALRVATPMRLFAKIGAPFVWLLQSSSNILLRLLGAHNDAMQGITEEEVKTLIAEGTESGVFDPAEQMMLEGVLRLGDRSVRTLMTPRPDVKWIDVDAPEDKQLQVLIEGGYARVPLARGTLDELVGVLHTKDIVAALLQGQRPALAKLARQPLTILDGTPVLRLLELFRDTRQHVAVVVDEHGSVEGIVTATDILESVMGDLPEHIDEDDTTIIRRDDGSYLIDAMKPIDEVMASLNLKGLRGENDDFHTLAGFMLKQLGHLPHTGEKFTWQDAITFEVIDMDGRRIDKVLVTLPAAPVESGIENQRN